MKLADVLREVLKAHFLAAVAIRFPTSLIQQDHKNGPLNFPHEVMIVIGGGGLSKFLTVLPSHSVALMCTNKLVEMVKAM